MFARFVALNHLKLLKIRKIKYLFTIQQQSKQHSGLWLYINQTTTSFFSSWPKSAAIWTRSYTEGLRSGNTRLSFILLVIQTVICYFLSQFLFSTLSGFPFPPPTSSLCQSSVFTLQWIQPVVKLPLRTLRVSKPAIISLSLSPLHSDSIWRASQPERWARSSCQRRRAVGGTPRLIEHCLDVDMRKTLFPI